MSQTIEREREREREREKAVDISCLIVYLWVLEAVLIH